MKKYILNLVKCFGYEIIKFDKDKKEFPADFSEEDIEVIKFVRPYTMTSDERIFSLMRAVEYIIKYKIEGAMVECGVWQGGSMMAVAKTLIKHSDSNRELFLFDTFEGMPEPQNVDLSVYNMNAREHYEISKNTDTGGSSFCYAPIDQVKNNFSLTHYSPDKVHFIKGKVEDTIPLNAPGEIALLRLDTDWYESTKHELEHLFPRVKKGGIIIIDDYGHWLGARKAVDEYFNNNNIQVLLSRIDYTGRIAVKM